MLILLSPAKTLDFEASIQTQKSSTLLFPSEAAELIGKLRTFSETEISDLMKLSSKLAKLNVAMYQEWQTNPPKENIKQAISVFKGEVYQGLAVENYEEKDFYFAQKHLRILSGLYGMLQPLDLIQAYRLEMGTKLQTDKAKNLYEFWQEKITHYLNEHLKNEESKVILNLASNEYFKAVSPKKLDKDIKPVFKDFKNGKYKVISFFAKKARGMMTSFIIKNQIQHLEEIKDFTEEDYLYSEEMSKDNEWVFVR